jgi:Uri superfamily endonuclease
VRQPGTYLLLLWLERPTRLAVGRLGEFDFPIGWYVYIGSALGGLEARLQRHLRRDKPLHWHIDYLRAEADLRAVVARSGSERLECQIAAQLAALPGAARPVSRFGASDCRCPSHLLAFGQPPDLRLSPDWWAWPLPGSSEVTGPLLPASRDAATS